MKKPIFILLILLTISHPVFSEEMGSASTESVETSSSSSNWQCWVFATSALLTAALGVVIVSLNPGSSSTAH
jgi:hypothetical protein